MNITKSRIAALLLATIGSSAFASVIVPIATSADGGYTATGPAHATSADASDSRRMGAAPAMPDERGPIDLFRSADGTPMALGGYVAAPGSSEPAAAAHATTGSTASMASQVTTRGNVE